MEECRVILLGKTGAGKSSPGNTLLGRDAFEVGLGLSSGTEKCHCADTVTRDSILQVTDTPGLCDTHRPEEEVLREVAKSVAVAAPGPHVVLMVLRCDKRFTAEEYGAYKSLKGLFGDAVCKHVILVFVGIDSTTRVPGERQSAVERTLRQSPPTTLQELMSDCSGRYFAVDNTAPLDDRKQQGRDLLSRIQELIQRNGGRYFTNKLCEDVSRDVEPMIQKRMEQDHVPREEATRTVRQDIVKEENVVKAILKRWVIAIGEALIPVIQKISFELAEKAAKKIKTSNCCVM